MCQALRRRRARPVRATHRSASGPGLWVRAAAAAAQSRASPEQRSAGRPLLAIRNFPGGSRGPAGSQRESQPALRAPASSLSLGRPRAPAPLREGGGILNKVPSPGPGGRGRSLVTRCPRHTPAASAEGRAGSARGWGWAGGEARLRIALSFLPALCQLNPQRGGGMGLFQTLSLESYSRNPFLR